MCNNYFLCRWPQYWNNEQTFHCFAICSSVCYFQAHDVPSGASPAATCELQVAPFQWPQCEAVVMLAEGQQAAAILLLSVYLCLKLSDCILGLSSHCPMIMLWGYQLRVQLHSKNTPKFPCDVARSAQCSFLQSRSVCVHWRQLQIWGLCRVGSSLYHNPCSIQLLCTDFSCCVCNLENIWDTARDVLVNHKFTDVCPAR